MAALLIPHQKAVFRHSEGPVCISACQIVQQLQTLPPCDVPLYNFLTHRFAFLDNVSDNLLLPFTFYWKHNETFNPLN